MKAFGRIGTLWSRNRAQPSRCGADAKDVPRSRRSSAW